MTRTAIDPPVSERHDTMSSVPALRTTDLIGRDAELEQLTAQLGIRASGGEASARAMLVAGDAGVGKTRVLMALRDAALEAGWQVVAGHCLDLADSSLPYLPFSEILGRVMADRSDVATRVLDQHPTLARLQPGRRIRSSETASGDQALDRGNVYDAFGDLLSAVAEQAPLLVMVEDAHWADESTRDMLSFLFSRPVPGVSLVVSYRSDDLHRRHPLRRQVAEWMRLRGVDRLQLEPLADDDVRLLVRALHPSTMSEAEYASIVDRAEGNPFFIEELVGAAWSGQVPGELADVLLVHLDRLDDTTRQVVRIVSVAGRQVSHELLAAVSDLGAAELEGALRNAVEAQRPRGLARWHLRLPARAARRGGLRRPAARRAGPAARRLRRRRSGRAAPLGTAAELAQHARRADDRPVAVRASIEAGEEALAVGGPSEAATHFLDALELIDTSRTPVTDVDAFALARRCAEALIAAGRVPKAVKVLRARLAALPPEGSDVDRGQLLTSLGAGADAHRHHRVAARDRGRGGRAAARRPAQAARPRAPRPRPEPEQLARRRGAQRSRSQALEIAERNDLTSLAVELHTTVAGLDPAGSASPSAGWRAAADRARSRRPRSSPSCARSTSSAGCTTTRATSTAPCEVYREVIARSEVGGLTWSPYPAEARLLLAVALTHQGRLDEAWDLLDVSGQNPPMVYEWLYFSHQMLIHDRHPRRAQAPARSSGCATTGAPTASPPSPPASAELLRAAAAGDAAGAPSGLRRRGRHASCRCGTTGSRPGSASRPSWSAPSPTPPRASPPTSARPAGAEVERMMADGGRVIDFYAPYDGSHGPEYRMWVARRTAEHLRWRWLAQVDPPSSDELVGGLAGRRGGRAWPTAACPRSPRRGSGSPGVLRAAGDAAGAREVGRPGARGRPRACGPSRCSPSSPPRARRPRRRPRPTARR